jgi:hypothetical protein
MRVSSIRLSGYLPARVEGRSAISIGIIMAVSCRVNHYFNIQPATTVTNILVASTSLRNIIVVILTLMARRTAFRDSTSKRHVKCRVVGRQLRKETGLVTLQSVKFKFRGCRVNILAA